MNLPFLCSLRSMAMMSCLVATLTVRAEELPTSPRLKQINALLEKEPQNATAIMDRGHAYALLGMKEKAMSDLQRAAALAPSDNPVLTRVAWSYFNLKEYRRALDTWLQAAAASGYTRYYDYYTVALGYWGVGDGLKATAFYDQAVAQEDTFGEWKTLVERTETWTWAEKDAIYRLFDAWRRGYRLKEEKKP